MDFDQLREASHTFNQAGRHMDALTAAEEAWRRFPERRHFTWYLVAYANLRLGRAQDLVAAVERAEAGNHLWRLSLLRTLQDELHADAGLLTPAIERAEARVAAKGYKAQVLIAPPADRMSDPGPLLLGFHGATSTARLYHEHWVPATRLGCEVASVQSSQPATETTFCWDDRGQVERDVAALLPDLPPHGPTIVTGFSQGAAVALDLALAGGLGAAEAVIGVGPSFARDPAVTRVARPLRVIMLHGTEDPWARTIPGTADALRSAGHDVIIERVAGMGHEFPGDFGSRLDGLLAKAGVATR